MKWLKKRFLQLSIHSQLEVGIISLSGFVSLLVISLIFINSFMLLNSYYNDLTIILDKLENVQIDGIAVNVAVSILTFTEVSKTGIQWIRNHLKNLERNEYLDVFDRSKFNKYMLTFNMTNLTNCENNSIFCTNNMTKCSNNFICTNKSIICADNLNNFIVNKNFKNNDNNDDFEKYKKRIILSFPFINMSLNYRILDLNKKQIFNNIVILSKNFTSVFIFPFKNENPCFNNITYFQNYSDNYNLSNIPNVSKIFLNQSPLLYLYKLSKDQSPFIIEDSFTYNTLSIKLIDNNIDDFISGYWSSNMIDEYSFNLTKYYKGVKIILFGIKINNIKKFEEDNSLISKGSCQYIKKLNNIDTPKTDSTLTSCINDVNGAENIKNYFQKDSYDPIWVKRRIEIPFITNETISYPIYYKIFQFMIPDNFTSSIIDTKFKFDNKYYLYVLKNKVVNDIKKRKVLFKITGQLLMIMLISFVLWIFTMIIIIFRLFSIIRDITYPINKIMNLISTLGDFSNEKNKILKLDDNDNLLVSDINEMNELMEICKKLIKGGFSYENNPNNKDQDLEYEKYNANSYNNISYVKFNNLIIDDEKVEKLTTSNANMILNYLKKDGIVKETNNNYLNTNEINTKDKSPKEKKSNLSNDLKNSILLTKNHDTDEAKIYSFVEDLNAIKKKRNSNHFLFKFLEQTNLTISAIKINI